MIADQLDRGWSVRLGVALLVALVAGVVSGCGGEASSTSSSSTSVSVTSSTITTTTVPAECSASQLDVALSDMEGLPSEVASTRGAIFDAAMACDYAGLEGLARTGSADFTFSFGDGSTEPGTYWRAREEAGEPVLATLVKILNMPGGRMGGQYVWPFAHLLDFGSLSPQEEDLLGQYFSTEDIAEWQAFGGYTGYRLAIDLSGEWLYFVAGD